METGLVLGGASLAVVIIVVIQALKKLGLQIKFVPVLALILGVIGGVLAALTSDVTMVVGIVGGLLAGASASGLYDNISVPFRKESISTQGEFRGDLHS